MIPSSRFLIRQVLKPIDWGKATAIVEYGPGVGTITTEILKRLRPDGVLIVLETNADFVAYLRRAFNDPRLKVVHESAEAVDQVLERMGLSAVDYVISGIPFTLIDERVRENIVRKTHAALRSDGAFLVYQFSGAVLPYLRRFFRQVHQDFELLNILPARLFYCLP